FTRATLEQARLTEEVALGAIRERQLFSVARHLRDLDAARRQEVHALRAVARQVDDLPRPETADLDVRQQGLKSLDGEVGQHVALSEHPQSSLLFASSHVSSLSFVAISQGLDKERW